MATGLRNFVSYLFWRLIFLLLIALTKQTVEKEASDQVASKFIIALDQSTQLTGYAIFQDKDLIAHGVFSPSGDYEHRIVKLRQWLLDKLELLKPNVEVYFEDIQLQDLGGGSIGITTFKKLAHVQGALIVTCIEENIPYTIVPAATWRKTCGVKGRVRSEYKPAAQAHVLEKYGIQATEDEADAICIGEHGVKNFSLDWSK